MRHDPARPGVDQTRLALIESLGGGSHASAADGMCMMEAVAYIAGEQWSDEPACACPVISAFLRSWNDDLAEGRRTALLLPLAPRVVGTRRPDREAARSFMAADWMIRVWAPALISSAGGVGIAADLEKLPVIRETADLVATQATTAAVQRRARHLQERRWSTQPDGDREPEAAHAWAAEHAGLWETCPIGELDRLMRIARADGERLIKTSGGDAAKAAALVAAGMIDHAAVFDQVLATALDAAHVMMKLKDQSRSPRVRAALQKSAVDLVLRMIEATA
jgi:hypothetical protein